MIPDKLRFTVSLVNNQKIQELNRKYRNRDYPTDVLSFELGEELPDGTYLVGDIVVSREQAEEQAGENSCTVEEEIAHLVAHGALHLLGMWHKE